MQRIATTFAVLALMLSFAWFVPPVSAEVLDLSFNGERTMDLTPTAPSLAQAAEVEFAALHEAPMPVARAIHASALRHAVPVQLVAAVAWKESNFKQSAVSPAGALGVMQLTPDTADTLKVDAHDMDENIDGGAKYLAKLLRRYDGDTRLALAAYNAGPGNVDRYEGVPPYKETQDYVRKIMARLENGPGVG
jgi:soluble lytic murein transglycosylase-like protein